MKGTRAAIRYAKAIFAVAKDQNITPAINDEMSLIGETVSGNKELYLLLNSPIVKPAQKAAVLKEVFANANDITKGLVQALAENKRLNILVTITEEYTTLYNEDNGKQKAIVTTAIPLTEDLSAKVLAKVKELTGKEAVIENKVDESILGGFILRVGDMQYNASIANKFNNLKRAFSQN